MRRIARIALVAALLAQLCVFAAFAQLAPSSAARDLRPAMAGVTMLDLKKLRSDDLEVIRPTGVTPITRELGFVRLVPGEYVAERVGEVAVLGESSAEDRKKWLLPVDLHGVDDAGRSLNLRPVVEIAGGGLRIEPETRRFIGSIHVGLEDIDRPNERLPLPNAIQILVTADVDQVDPNRVNVDHTNLPFEEVRLAVADPNDEVKVHIRTSFDRRGSDVSVPVVRAKLQLRATPQRVQGLGLEVSRLTVRSDGLDKPEGTVVTLSSDSGSLAESNVALDAAGAGETTLRSIGLGPATVLAESPRLESAEARVAFAAPVAFMLAALFGGIAGSAIRWGGLRAKSQPNRSIWFAVGIGALTGIAVAAAYAVGINLTGYEPKARAGEALVFVMALLGAYLGMPKPQAGAPPATGDGNGTPPSG